MSKIRHQYHNLALSRSFVDPGDFGKDSALSHKRPGLEFLADSYKSGCQFFLGDVSFSLMFSVVSKDDQSDSDIGK